MFLAIILWILFRPVPMPICPTRKVITANPVRTAGKCKWPFPTGFT